MYNVNTNAIFYDFLLFFKDSAQNLRTPFSPTLLNGCFQNSLADISNFLLGFIKAICCKFLSLYDGQHIPDIPERYYFLILCYQFFSFFKFI